MMTLGIDLAAQPENTAACAVQWMAGVAEVRKIECRLTDSQLLDLISAADKVGIDVPLGWPVDFVNAIAKHHECSKWPHVETQRLRYRATDLFIAQKVGRWPLSVSTDRIGVAAMRAASLIARIEAPVHRSGAGKLTEVYPAAALRRWKFECMGYKGRKGAEKRQTLLEAFLRETNNWMRLSDSLRQNCERNDHSFDALICALVARARAVQLTEPIMPGTEDCVRVEGWIALPLADSLSRLACD